MYAQSGDSVLVQGDVEPAVHVETRGDDLRAVAPHTPRPLLPGRRHGTGSTPEGIPVKAVLVVPKVSLRVVA